MKQSFTRSISRLAAAVSMLTIASAALAKDEAKPRGPFSLAWSEYPSWSVFDVAHVRGYINRAPGKLGTLEKKWNVDIVLKEAEYDPCITMYAAGEVDAVAITNMDILKPSLSRPAVVVLPTSTSYGADALLVSSKIKNIDDLKKVKVRGLELSVSEYMFARNLELQNKQRKDFKFVSMDPGAAAMAMQQKQKGMDAIAVWNPFVLDTLEKRKGDVRVLFDSTSIPGEIIDLVAVAQSSLTKEGGADFAHALIEAFYAVNADLANPQTRRETLIALGEKFSALPPEKMEKVLEQTRFFSTPQEGMQVLNNGPLLTGVTEKNLQQIMPTVVDFCLAQEIVPQKPTIAYAAKEKTQLIFDSTYINGLTAKK